MSKTKLKSCPFCGGEASYLYSTDTQDEGVSVMCDICRAKICVYRLGDSREFARKAWNRRVLE